MDSFPNLVDNLAVKLNQLLKNKKEVESELKALKDRNKILQARSNELEQEVEQLKEKNKILRIAGGTKGEGQREIKLKINEIVREVDKCIAQLNQ